VTAQLRLEAVCLRHAPELQRIAADPRVGNPAGLDIPLPEQWAASFCAWRARAFDEHEAVTFAMVHRNVVVGCVGIHDLDWHRRVGEFAIWMARPYWGRGLAAQAGRAVLRIGFEDLGIERVRARSADDNRRALRLLKRVGFGPEAPTARDHIRQFSLECPRNGGKEAQI
jgi:RimJ/RimL family protein N-acetyltransferase